MGTSIHAPLADPQDIRLMSLSPSNATDGLVKCTVDVVSLRENPTYEAVSWEWGDITVTEIVMINGQPYKIPRTLAQALEQFRLIDKPRRLWVDAICISQDNLQERSAQVSLMHEIYSNATVVLVWLGAFEDSIHSDVFPLYEQLNSGLNIRQIYSELLLGDGQSFASDEEWFSYLDELHTPTEEEEDFLAQFSSPFQLGWWERLWVVQEVVLAKEVQICWGDSSLSLPKLINSYDLLKADLQQNLTLTSWIFGSEVIQEFLDLTAKFLEPIIYLRRLYLQLRATDWSDRPQDLYCFVIEILAICRYRYSSDGRDKVYGLLGLLPEEIPRQIAPSYLKAKESVMSDIASVLLLSAKTFMLFDCINPDDSSWIPDWDDGYHHYQNFHVRVGQQKLFTSSGSIGWQTTVTPAKLLRVKGIRVDLIKSYVDSAPRDVVDALDVYGNHENWQNLLVEQYLPAIPGSEQRYGSEQRRRVRGFRYPNGGTLGEAIYRTALNDCVPLTEEGTLCRAQPEDWMKFGSWFEQMELEDQADIMYPKMSTPSEGLRFPNGCMGKVLEAVRSCTLARDLFSTEIGYLGLIREEFNSLGDEIWILAGGSHPVVLRPTDKPGYYNAIAEVYVHGIMDGQVVQGECPILPEDNNAEAVRRDLGEGRKSWPIPEWTDIHIT